MGKEEGRKAGWVRGEKGRLQHVTHCRHSVHSFNGPIRKHTTPLHHIHSLVFFGGQNLLSKWWKRLLTTRTPHMIVPSSWSLYPARQHFLCFLTSRSPALCTRPITNYAQLIYIAERYIKWSVSKGIWVNLGGKSHPTGLKSNRNFPLIPQWHSTLKVHVWSCVPDEDGSIAVVHTLVSMPLLSVCD